MASTSLIALAAMLLSGSADANNAQPRVAAVAVARATIVAGVHAGPPTAQVAQRPEQRLPVKPRERPCPETDPKPCRLIVTDMP